VIDICFCSQLASLRAASTCHELPAGTKLQWGHCAVATKSTATMIDRLGGGCSGGQFALRHRKDL